MVSRRAQAENLQIAPYGAHIRCECLHKSVPFDTPDADYFHHLFTSLTDSRIPSQAKQDFAQTYSTQFGLNQSESQSLAAAAQQFSSAATAAKASSLPIVTAGAGGSLSSAAQQSLSQIGAAFEAQVSSLGSQFLATVRPAVAARIQEAMAGKH